MRDFDPFHNKRLARRGVSQKLLGILESAGLMGLHRASRDGDKLKAIDYGYGIKVIRRRPGPVEELEELVAPDIGRIVLIEYGFNANSDLAYCDDGIGDVWTTVPGATTNQLVKRALGEFGVCAFKNKLYAFDNTSIGGVRGRYQWSVSGRVWNSSIKQMAGFPSGEGSLYCCAANDTCMMVFYDSFPTFSIYRTTTGEEDDWTKSTLNLQSSFPDGRIFTAKYYPELSKWVAVDLEPRVYESDDDGVTWNEVADLAVFADPTSLEITHDICRTSSGRWVCGHTLQFQDIDKDGHFKVSNANDITTWNNPDPTVRVRAGGDWPRIYNGIDGKYTHDGAVYMRSDWLLSGPRTLVRVANYNDYDLDSATDSSFSSVYFGAAQTYFFKIGTRIWQSVNSTTNPGHEGKVLYNDGNDVRGGWEQKQFDFRPGILVNFVSLDPDNTDTGL